jgi:hypothetical protein
MNSSSLNEHLFIRNLVDFPNCACGQVESTSHFFISCKKYTDLRNELMYTICHLIILCNCKHIQVLNIIKFRWNDYCSAAMSVKAAGNFADFTKSVIWRRTIQWQEEKRTKIQAMIYQTLHRKTKDSCENAVPVK